MPTTPIPPWMRPGPSTEAHAEALARRPLGPAPASVVDVREGGATDEGVEEREGDGAAGRPVA